MIQNEIIEIERRYIIQSTDSLEKLIKNLDFQGESRDIDTYFDTKEGDLFKKGIFLRSRNSSKLEFKFNKDDFLSSSSGNHHNYCSEHPFNLPLKEEDTHRLNQVLDFLGLNKVKEYGLSALLESNHLIQSVDIDKTRKKYLSRDNGYEICIDDVDGLGQFLEIEYQAKPNENVSEILINMDEFLVSLNLSHLTVGYVELYWKKNNYALYKSGKYLLAEENSVIPRKLSRSI